LFNAAKLSFIIISPQATPVIVKLSYRIVVVFPRTSLFLHNMRGWVYGFQFLEKPANAISVEVVIKKCYIKVF
jgi:hypothetical protein